MKLITLTFLIMAFMSFAVLITVRIAENEWYENLEGQCGINDNGTCEGWQFSAIFLSFLSLLGSSMLYLISRIYDRKKCALVALHESGGKDGK